MLSRERVDRSHPSAEAQRTYADEPNSSRRMIATKHIGVRS